MLKAEITGLSLWYTKRYFPTCNKNSESNSEQNQQTGEWQTQEGGNEARTQ